METTISIELVADIAHRRDPMTMWSEFSPQTTDIHVDDVGQRVLVDAPNRIENPLAREDPPAIAHEQQQEGAFFAGQVHGFFIDGDLLGPTVTLHTSDPGLDLRDEIGEALMDVENQRIVTGIVEPQGEEAKVSDEEAAGDLAAAEVGFTALSEEDYDELQKEDDE